MADTGCGRPARDHAALLPHLPELAEMTGMTFEATIRVVSCRQQDRLLRNEGARLISENPIRTNTTARPE